MNHKLVITLLLAVVLRWNPSFAETTSALPVKQWPGKRFIILPKQKIVQVFGYGLYRTPQLDRSKNKPDLEMETKERRIRCEKFTGSVIDAQDVKPSGKEYIVHFIHEPTRISLFGMTHRGAIEGLALFEDLAKARQRWQGAAVYSMRRFINVYDSTTGNVNTQKVKIEDPLRVVELRWGTTPLPPQPIWLMVETPRKISGFIPVSISWTNSMIDKITHGNPWDDDILEQDPRKVFSWDNVVWNAIDNHSIISSMTKSQVRLSWGQPKTIRKDNKGIKNGEYWQFDNEQELYFMGDSLVSIGGQ